MYVVYVWTGGWLISLVLVTSDNKGLLLLLLLLLFNLFCIKIESNLVLLVFGGVSCHF